ncbi:MAG: hypothetical protein SFW36_14455, partial [Leptolyngbyaceae cyanobacterium bins.59]|nr:hypothetical protein [Leptolyngbyaceae cyanobacterium bins.59]
SISGASNPDQSTLLSLPHLLREDGGGIGGTDEFLMTYFYAAENCAAVLWRGDSNNRHKLPMPPLHGSSCP